MLVFLTRDSKDNVLCSHVDVWTKRPIRKASADAWYRGVLWISSATRWQCFYLGEYKAEIVARVFGVVPADDKECLEVDVASDKLLLVGIEVIT